MVGTELSLLRTRSTKQSPNKPMMMKRMVDELNSMSGKPPKPIRSTKLSKPKKLEIECDACDFGTGRRPKR